MRTRWVLIAVPALILIFWLQMLHAIRGQSLTWDEGDHIFAGYESLKTHDFGLNPEHPPMVKMIGALPLLPLDLKVPTIGHRFFKDEAYLDGRELLFHNGPADGGHYNANTLIFRARLFASVFALLAATLVFLGTAEMFSLTAGLIALILFCFEPNLIAHGAYVTTDMAASCTIFATIYAFWRWVKVPSTARLLTAGLAGGLALAAKHSTILLAPMLLLLATITLYTQHRENSATRITLARMLAALAAITVIAAIVLWAFYGFRYNARPAGLALSPSLADYVKPLAPNEARGVLFLAHWHLLPESYLYGLADVRIMANDMPSFLLGRVYAHGTWMYFPIDFVIKSTLSLLALLTLTLFAIARRWLRPSLSLAFVTIPPIVYMLVSMGSHLNIGARHILPVFLFCCVLCGAGAAALIRTLQNPKARERWTLTVLALLIFHIATTVHASPNYISYANEAFGGPTQTYRYLSDSNTDWAQQLIAVSDELRARNIQHCYIAYFATPFILPSDYGIPCELLPTPDSHFTRTSQPTPSILTGPVLISAGDLNGFELGSSVLNPYESFRSLQPTRFIQNGVFWFDGTFTVPLAAALPHVELSTIALRQHDIPQALAEAQQAQLVAPGEVEPELALGDALTASGDVTDARAAYARAGQKIDTMEPDARQIWHKKLSARLAALPAH